MILAGTLSKIHKSVPFGRAEQSIMQHLIKLGIWTLNLWRSSLCHVCFVKLMFSLYFSLFAGDEDGNREAGDVEMEGQSEKSRNVAVGPEEWDGPSKKSISITSLESFSSATYMV